MFPTSAVQNLVWIRTVALTDIGWVRKNGQIRSTGFFLKEVFLNFAPYEQGSERKQQMAKEYREKVEKELRDICNDVLVSFFLNRFIY